MKCDFCDEEAVTGVGYKYCMDHLGIFESTFFEQAVREYFKSAEEMETFFIQAFGSRKPKISDLQKWHDKIPRKENPPEEQESWGIYVEEQDKYIRRILDAYLKSKEVTHD